MAVTIAQKARVISDLLREVSIRRSDMLNNRARLIELVDLINTFSLPTSWMGIDDKGMLHVTFIVNHKMRGPASLIYEVDVYWEYDSLARTVTCRKCRDDSYQTDKTYNCTAVNDGLSPE